MAEMELRVLTRHCIGRRFDTAEAMDRQMAAWPNERHAKQLGANWRFKTADARIKLKALYPN